MALAEVTPLARAHCLGWAERPLLDVASSLAQTEQWQGWVQQQEPLPGCMLHCPGGFLTTTWIRSLQGVAEVLIKLGNRRSYRRCVCQGESAPLGMAVTMYNIWGGGSVLQLGGTGYQRIFRQLLLILQIITWQLLLQIITWHFKSLSQDFSKIAEVLSGHKGLFWLKNKTF